MEYIMAALHPPNPDAVFNACVLLLFTSDRLTFIFSETPNASKFLLGSITPSFKE